MKKIALLILLGLGLTAQAQWYTGMSQKTGLALCIHLTDSAAELYSPMQTTDPIPVSGWSLQGDKLTLECKSIGLKMNLTRHEDGWRGYWKQGLFKEDITLLPTDTLFTLRRPQTPQPPYRFDEDTVSVDYTDSQGNQVHLEGTLSVPRGSALRHPCLVLVSGSGQQNRDEEIFQHKPFLVLADYLASRGIAVLRYDDRGVGASTGDAEHGTTALFSEDAEAMFRAVKGNKHIDPARLGIGGHSEGGAIAPMVAARNKEVKFVVMLAGQGCTGRDVLLQQNEAIYRAAGLGDSLLALRQACMRELLAMPAGSSQKDYKAVIDRHTAGLTKEQVDSIGFGRGAAATMKQQMDLPWMQTFLTLDPADYLPQVTCPVLALNGGKDSQVLARPNLDRVKQLCPRADCRELPGLNHLFQHCTTGSPDEYILIEETFAPEALQALADWILKL
ncbi:MAG: alpha/beta fold hydrolase [Bacteroidales bacterium]|nr:alpha/beta fold hydrolase [Bacteroidales bacterium]